MRRKMLAALLAALCAAPPARAQGTTPLVRTLFTSDTLALSSPALSPDGRWLVMVRYISNQETRLMIRPAAGGQLRELFAQPGTHGNPRFTPQGDRLVFVSSLPRRAATDDRSYLVSAAFEARTGTLSGTPRQISLDGVRGAPRVSPAISPDGRWVAYVECCNVNALKVVPINGGNARLVVPQPSGRNQMTSVLGWTTDSRFVTYEVREQGQATRMKVGLEGGSPVAIAKAPGTVGFPSPDNKYFFHVDGAGVRPTLHVRDAQAREIAAVPVFKASGDVSFTSDGKHLLAAGDNSVAPLRLAPVAGGSIRTIGRGDSYEWAEGWSSDAQAVAISSVENGHLFVSIVDTSGKVLNKVRLPDLSIFVGFQNGWVAWREGAPGRFTEWRIVAQNLKDGTQRELVRNVVARICCDPVGPGGMYYGIIGNEFYYRQVKGERYEVRAMRMDGTSRLLADLPRNLLDKTGYAVYGNRVVYKEPVGDSVRLRLLTSPRGPARTLATFPDTASIGEFYWSHDGRQLFNALGGSERTLLIYSFDAAGNVQGKPRTITLPFEYAYEMFWLPDGSGLTMIAQPRGSAVTEVALVKFSDPEHPVYLTKDDPVSKWGHALSPDGKWVAYPSEQLKGTSIYTIDVAELLKRGMPR